MSGGSELVFIYGTLRTQAGNAFRMEGARRISEGRVRGQLYRLDGYPAMVPDEEADRWVVGEVWEVSATKFAELDAYENE